LALIPEQTSETPVATPAPVPVTEPLLALLQQALGHELPNQLVAVQGMARLLDAEAADQLGPDGKEYIQRLGAAAQRAHELVRTLADLIRVLRRPGVVSHVSLADVIRDVAAELKALCGGRAIEYDLPEHGPMVTLPAVVSRQVVSHLLRYLVQSEVAPTARPVVVGARATSAGAVWWGTDPDRTLSPAECGRLFEPFAGRNGAGAAPGLGLVLAKLLVENCGGTINVEAGAERGTTVRVVFEG
jgi:signal transduction histidine kinase